MKLFTYPGNKNAFKALITAEYVGVKIEVPPFEMGVDNQTPEFLAMNPFGKVPVLSTENGAVFESNAIARYIARLNDCGLFGTTLEDYAAVEQWISYASSELDGPLCSWLYPFIFSEFFPYDKKKESAAIDALKRSFETLDKFLEDKTFLVKDRVTLADIIFVCTVLNGFKLVFDDAFLKPYQNLKRYYTTLVHQPEFIRALGAPEFCKTPLKHSAPSKKKESAAESKSETPKETAPPAKEEKPKSWLDLLPPTSMPLDSFKRLYSNCPARGFRDTFVPRMWNGGSIPNSPSEEVFPGMDLDGYSFWFADYKYDVENTVDFMVMNKVGGFLQRMDFARKFAFGVLGIYKDEEKGIFPIKGFWIFRGSEIPEVVTKESDDMELYTLTKVDLTDPAQKKRLEDIICEDEKVDGLELVSAKIFK
eukprot:g7082.t1